MSTVVQAAEHVVVESGTAVVTQVVKSTTRDLKTIESSVVNEAVSATDEDAPSLLGKVQDGLADVATEVVKGAESSAVEIVEQHPELVAEGALAVVLGAASLVQPELMAGEVALIGKMAADSAKKTATTIASNTGSKVVKAISTDLADDAKEEQATDVAAEAAKENTEGAKVVEAVIPEASDPKAATVETVKDGPNSSIFSPLDAKSTPGSESATLETANIDSNCSASGPSDTKTTPPCDTAPKAAPSIPQSAPISEHKAETVQAAQQTIKDTPKEKEEVGPQTTSPISKPAPVSEQKTETTSHELLQATDDIASVSPPTIVAAVAKVTSTTKTIPNTTPEETTGTTEVLRMVTVSQESLDLLHQKIDTMHEAIQQITKVLAFYMPARPPSADGSNSIENAEAIINEALATAVKPLTNLVPEIMAKSDDSTHPPSVDPSTPKPPPTRPNPEKRTSVIGSIGKVLWPFGFLEKVATVTVTEVSSDRIEVGG